MKVLVVVGTRPEVIKLAPVVRALRDVADVRVCASGQHREMLQQALEAFGLVPDIALDAMSPGRTLNILSARLLEALDAVLESEQPDWVLVQGDTTTALCAGLAAFHRGIRVGHVEAGLRTGDLASPFPEEANRSLLARISTLHFAPTEAAARALESEGVDPTRIHITGNTVVDAIYATCSGWPEGIPATLPDSMRALVTRRFVLLTCHRRENFGQVMEGICAMVARLCARYADMRWVFPMHLNPAVREPVRRLLGAVPNLLLTDPVDYASSLWLISQAALVVSDSGGIQEEAPTFGTPVVVMREHTERREGVEAGFATLAGQEPARIEAAIDAWLAEFDARERLVGRANPYGDGQASARIAAWLSGGTPEAFHV